MLGKLKDVLYRSYERMLSREVLDNGPIPSHIAIIMDGNRRFASRMGKPKHIGHYHGANVTESVIEWAYELNVEHLTLYAFSTENFKRPSEELESLFKLIGDKFDELRVSDRTHERRLRIRAIGDINRLPKDLQRRIKRAEESTRGYDGMYLNVALAYGGRQEIVHATRLIARRALEGEIKTVSEEVIGRHLYPSEGYVVPDVDLIIRTGGEERTSNFLPWQACGNECAAYFCTPYWPEFRKIDLLRAIRTYQEREVERRRSTVRRVAALLRECGRLEAGEVARVSRRALGVSADEMGEVLDDLDDVIFHTADAAVDSP